MSRKIGRGIAANFYGVEPRGGEGEEESDLLTYKEMGPRDTQLPKVASQTNTTHPRQKSTKNPAETRAAPGQKTSKIILSHNKLNIVEFSRLYW